MDCLRLTNNSNG